MEQPAEVKDEDPAQWGLGAEQHMKSTLIVVVAAPPAKRHGRWQDVRVGASVFVVEGLGVSDLREAV